MEDAEGFAAAALLANAGAEEGFDVRKGAAVENGELEVIDFDDDVVDAHPNESGEKVLGGGDEHALAHKAGGVTHFGDVTCGSGDFEVVEIGAAEDDARAGGGGQKTHGGRCTGVQADPGEFERFGYGLFEVDGLGQCATPKRCPSTSSWRSPGTRDRSGKLDKPV